MNSGFKSNSIFGGISLACLLVYLFMVTHTSAGHGKVDNEGLYKLLNISKKANTKEIRIAFKKIALIKHPDKNQVNYTTLIYLMNLRTCYLLLQVVRFSSK